MSTVFKTEKLSRIFKSGNTFVHALNNVNLDIIKGELTVLKGPSGSGKTTLINLLGGLDTPTEGKVFFNDKDLYKFSGKYRDKIRRTDMGFVFQSVALVSMMSAYENIDFSLRISGVPASGRKKIVQDALELVGLSKRMNHKPYELSGGEQQRVAIARAIAHKPKVVFADEPTAELDTVLGLRVVKLFKKLVTDEGITVVMTTHDPSMLVVADRIYTLNDGEVVLDEKT